MTASRAHKNASASFSEEDAVSWASAVLTKRFLVLGVLTDCPDVAFDQCEKNISLRKCWRALAFVSWSPATTAINDMARGATEEALPLPRWLQRAVIAGLRPKPRRGRKRTAVARNAVIAATIEEVAVQFELRIYRNAASQHCCACSVVRAALCSEGTHLSLDSVAKIAGTVSPFASAFCRALDEIARDISYDIDDCDR